ncbi:fimbrial protein [Enterobacter quasiroggenkampii]|uniref:fimbrial protein n=1 Tax=Enterobacter quasiroggenkampii TaxID=2497436 RepID=UPI0021CFC435|nr:fimbrial protein [Enterobacter quasiroggenkampii]MCU6359046.1 fimbrial protein [Enterobacter quasiroggenkampii]
MKKSILNLSLAMLMGMTGYTNAAPVTVNGGVVHFKGSVVDAPCVVDNDSTAATVDLGQVKTSSATTTGSVIGAAKPFTIHLTDCALDTYTNAAVTFTGLTVSGKPDQLAVNGGGAGSATATGIAIQVLDNTGKVVPVDGSAASTAQKLTTADNYLQYSAQYVAIADTITAGAANADANFNITYN